MPDRVRRRIRWAILRAREEERRELNRLRRRKMAATMLGLISLSAATYYQFLI